MTGTITAKINHMKNKLKKLGIGCLFAVTMLLLNSSCTYQGDQQSKQKMIKGYYAAYEKKDWNMLNSLLADGFNFTSPNDNHIDLKAYKERCSVPINAYNIKRFDIEKLMINDDDAFVTYNGLTTDGRVFRNTEYFKFKGGKIKENACFFGPGVSYPNNKAK